MTSVALEVDGLAVEVAGAQILSSVRLSLPAGGIVGIVGESGSGKTMTSRVLTGTLGRIDGKVTDGVARLGSIDLTTLDEKGWRKVRGHRIALVPQSSQSALDPLMTIRDQMIETINALEATEHPEQRAKELLRDVRLDPDARLLDAHAHELSGGMRQRVMIALALVGDADILIGDEATTALDVTVQREILELLRNLRDRRGLSLVLITHDLDVVRNIADTVAIMYAGMTVETGPTEQVLGAPQHPYTVALLGAQPSRSGGDRRLANIEGSPPLPGDWAPGCRFAPRCRHQQSACNAAVPELRALGPRQDAACVRAEELGP